MAVTQSTALCRSQEPPMSVADRDRVVFQQYADELGAEHVRGVAT